jgi:hypothetical protein
MGGLFVVQMADDKGLFRPLIVTSDFMDTIARRPSIHPSRHRNVDTAADAVQVNQDEEPLKPHRPHNAGGSQDNRSKMGPSALYP